MFLKQISTLPPPNLPEIFVGDCKYLIKKKGNELKNSNLNLPRMFLCRLCSSSL